MCVIIIKQKGKTISPEIAKTSGRINPHGLGIIWLDTFEVTYHKSSEYKKLLTTRPFIAHFRYATVGAIGKDNTHPFQCGAVKNEYLMMNGTIKNLGNAKDSDTKVLANQLGDIPRHTWKQELSKYMCRFVSVNTRNRTYQIYNKELWTQVNGVWYSKTDVIEDNLIAVYGTLKKGHGNYNYYLSDSKHIGGGVTQDKYPLVIDGLPYLIEDKGVGHNVVVDVFKVNDSLMKELDRLEGHPNWYRRKQIPIKIAGKVLMCWVYFNIKEKVKGRTMHKSYETPKKVVPSQYALGFDTYTPPVTTRYYFEDMFGDDEFSVDKEKPVCINCYHDLEHDFFSNYHCVHCDEWFSEADALRVF